jgi:hypothetical protein
MNEKISAMIREIERICQCENEHAQAVSIVDASHDQIDIARHCSEKKCHINHNRSDRKISVS